MPTLYPLVLGREVMVATEHYLSAAAGARLFAQGGNAIDAAVAATFVEGVVNPHMHTLGGEAPMMLYAARAGRVVAVNGNTAAPGAATIEHFRSLGLELIPGEGLLAAGVPAAADALLAVLEQFGTKRLCEVAEPARELCEQGFPAHLGLTGQQGLAPHQIGGVTPVTLQANADKFLNVWPSSGRVYLPSGRPPRAGEIIRNPALARCFKRMVEAEASARNRGREAGIEAARARFYRGDIAEEIVAWSRSNGGLLEREDLARFQTRLEEPVSADFRGVTVFKCPPWSQGLVFLQQLRLLEGFELRRMGHNSADYIHTVTEAAKLAFADREAYYADPAFVEVPVQGLLSRRYAELRRALIDPAQAAEATFAGDPVKPAARLQHPQPAGRWNSGTTQIVTADREGNLVSITASGGWLPSSPVIEELGFPLGSRIQTFYLDRAHANALMPGKRPRTTLTPSLAARQGVPVLAFGTMGGDQQDQWTLQFFLNHVEFAMDLQEAVEAPKFSSGHFPSSFYPHAARPKLLRLESRIDRAVREELDRRGHRVMAVEDWSEGFVLAVGRNPSTGLLEGAADPRGQISGVMPAHVVGW